MGPGERRDVRMVSSSLSVLQSPYSCVEYAVVCSLSRCRWLCLLLREWCKTSLMVSRIHHPSEIVSKSTAMHAKMLAPSQVEIARCPDMPDIDPSSTVLLFPSDVRQLSAHSVRFVCIVCGLPYVRNCVLRMWACECASCHYAVVRSKALTKGVGRNSGE